MARSGFRLVLDADAVVVAGAPHAAGTGRGEGGAGYEHEHGGDDDLLQGSSPGSRFGCSSCDAFVRERAQVGE